MSVTAVLERLRTFAESGRMEEFRALYRNSIIQFSDDPDTLINIAAVMSNYGFLSDARACYTNALDCPATNPRSIIANLANSARESGEHDESRRLYNVLLNELPNHPVIRRNALISLEYDPNVSEDERFQRAKSWGSWAVDRAGGYRDRPSIGRPKDSLIRLGYVSSDLCQHTVGLFVKDILASHDKSRVEVFAYSAGIVKDWLTREIVAACAFRDVSSLNDQDFAQLIRADGIDVLIDLSGHTAGSRLTAFAYRPAPVMVSWLGYFATTGLHYMDAILLDKWHAPTGTESQFIEPIIRLQSGRFCYQPAPWAPSELAPPPFQRNGFITYGCFNNTAKLNNRVFNVWSKIIRSTPNARLILKWRTFNDKLFRQKVIQAFVDRGVEHDRIELRGPSFHLDLLKEYADIDIALDPFPFTGGLTSCEALWMGVPVVTLPQKRVVSRQTMAFLIQIGLHELVAETDENYVQVALKLAGDRERLADLRASLRERMQASPLMDLIGFTRNLENELINLYRRIESQL